MVTIENHPFYDGRSMKDGVGFGAGEVTGDGTDFCRHSATRHRRVSFKDDVDLEALVADMHSNLTDSVEEDLISSSSRDQATSCFSWLDAARHQFTGQSDSDDEGQGNAGFSTRRFLEFHRHNKKDGKLSKSMSLPLSHVAPDPFPELANSRATPTVTYIPSTDACKTLAASPLLRSRSLSHSPSSPPWSYSRIADTPERTDSENVVWSPTENFGKTMLNFYLDDKSHKSVLVEDSMKASDVGYLLALKNHTGDGKTWAVVETISKFQLERSLEDHESVLQVYRSWGHVKDNRFYFKKDFRKYELFRNPMQFFPPPMLDIKDIKANVPELISRPEQQRSVLLQNLLQSCEPLPDIQGYLYIREGRKSWKKRYFILRQSGLYHSSKGTSKDPRYLVLLSHLADLNIYLANNAKKVLGAPNQYAFCLKPTYSVNDIRQMKCFCAEDEQTRACWTTGLRLIKYGSQLRENYKLAIKREDKLQSIENRSMNIQSTDSLYVKSRVAMDFTGRGGRVVSDPNEAVGVAMEEGQGWRRKMSQPQSGSAGSKYTSLLSDYTMGPTQGLMIGIHVTQPWFHSGISREDAVQIIAEQGQVDGLFLMRESQSLPGTYVLSLVHHQKVKHCQIHLMDKEKEICFSLDGGHTRFSDLLQLVEFYQLNAGALPTRLTHYVTRLT